MLTSQIPDRRIPYCVSVERVEASGGRGTSGLAQPLKLLILGVWGSNTKKRDFALRCRLQAARNLPLRPIIE